MNLPTGEGSSAADASEDHPDEPGNRELRLRAASRLHGGKYIAGTFVNVAGAVEFTGLSSRGDKGGYELLQVLVCFVHVRLAVQNLRERSMMGPIGTVPGIGDQDRFKRSDGALVPVTDRFQFLYMRTDLTAMPRCQNLRHFLEVFVKRGATNSGLLRDASHGQAVQSFHGRYGCGVIHDRIGDGGAMRFDSVVPELWHEIQGVTLQ